MNLFTRGRLYGRKCTFIRMRGTLSACGHSSYHTYPAKMKHIREIHSNKLPNTLVRNLLWNVLVFTVVAATLGSWIAVKYGAGLMYRKEDYSAANIVPPLDLPIVNSTIFELAEVQADEPLLRMEIQQLMEGAFANISRYRTFATWPRFFHTSHDIRGRTSTGMLMNLRSPKFSKVWLKFNKSLDDWSRKKRFQPDILDELVELIKFPIDMHNGMFLDLKKYSSCAVVGNSGILLSTEYGELIDNHEAVIRINNPRILPFKKNVGSKTSISFINSNILHLCARRDDCFCHPYGVNTPIVMWMCQPAHHLDYVACNSSHKAPLILTDPRFDMLCARIAKYYSLKRFADKTLQVWNSVHGGSMFHYSSSLQAVMLALGVCDKVSLFGFGKSDSAKHHYHDNQKMEVSLHDYLAEYNFYRDLVERPRAVPFIPGKFKFPQVVVHH